jgi:hypothetical protein
MNIDTQLEKSTLTVTLDVRHPFCFLALGPALSLANECGFEINWLPRAAEPLRPPKPTAEHDDRGIRHRHHRAQMVGREIAVYAEAQSLTIKDPYRNGSADALHMAWLYVRNTKPDVFEALLVKSFRRYWSLELDVSDVNAAAKLVTEFAGDAREYKSWASTEGPTALCQVGAELDAVGAVTAPTYLACGQVFQGRQHLPMIRWLLDGEIGPFPN